MMRLDSGSPPVDRYADGSYAALNPGWHVRDSAWKAEQLLAMLSRHGLAPGSVAEIGCGAGEVLVRMQAGLPTGTRLEGWDISPDAIRLARERAGRGISFHQGDLLSESAGGYDLIVAADVVEHVPDYLGFLERLRTQATWKLFHLPLDLSVQSLLRRDRLLRSRRELGHLHYFTRQTALAALVDSGYAVVDHAFTAPSLDRRCLRDPLPRLLRPARLLLYRMRPDFAARALGGFSLLVLAR
jgi:SAM-dependent methyltransferase